VTLAYLVITLVMTRPFSNLSSLGSASYDGDARLMIWTLAWDNHAVLDRVPLFDANIFYPAKAALSFNEHLFGLSLFTLPIYAATRNPVLAYNIAWLASFLLRALAMYALAMRHTRSTPAAFVAGLVYAFSFYSMHHAYGHLSLIWVWWLPLSLLWLERWIEEPTLGRASLWMVALVLQALTSWYLAVMVLVANGLALLWWLAATVRTRWLARGWQFLAVAAAGAAAIWPFAARYGSLEQPGLTEVASLSADWASYFMPPENTWLGQWWLAHLGVGPRWIWGERTLFLGWIAVALAGAGAGIAMRRGRWRVLGAYVLIVLIGLALSFGPSMAGPSERSSAFGLLAHLPGVAGIRAPARFSLLVVLGSALFSAQAVAAARRWRARHAGMALVLIVPFMLGEWFVVKLPGGPPRPAVIPAVYRSPHLRTARAIVSLPDYRGSLHWFLGSDYLYYSTAHWRPIVNGYGRAEPPDFLHVISHMNAFPGPNNAKTMRQLGVEYVVLHASRYPDAAVEIIRVARESPEYELVEQIETDYLFRVKPR